jgi:hypothetical protein
MELAWRPALPTATESDLLRLFSVLWRLEFCQPCLESDLSSQCQTFICPRRTACEKFDRYVAYYKRQCGSYDPANDGSWRLNTHDGIRAIIAMLQANPDQQKLDIRQRLSSNLPRNQTGDKCDQPDMDERDSAIDLAASVMTMINCLSQESSSLLLEEGSNRLSWRPGVPFSAYIELVLPQRQGPDRSHLLNQSYLDASCPLVTAKELKRVAKTRLQGTDDITSHLRYDVINNVLFIFHHTSFLKEQLRLSKDCADNPTVSECLKVYVLPR